MTTTQLLAAAGAGLGLGLGLIVAIGAQNAFVLRQGIRRERVLAVVVVCIASDAVLIVAGVAGAGALFAAVPWLVTVARWGGALFLLGYAVRAVRRALRPPGPQDEGLRVDPEPGADVPRGGGAETTSAGARPARTGTARPAGASMLTARPPRGAAVPGPVPSRPTAVVATALALTWLNPHVYLDTFVLLGSVGSSHGPARWAFAAGAVLASALWFSGLGCAARALAPAFARPNAWRVLDGAIAVVMVGVAAGLVLGG